jgi:hypothetical protein
MLSENYLKSTILTEILNREKDSNKSMLVPYLPNLAYETLYEPTKKYLYDRVGK